MPRAKISSNSPNSSYDDLSEDGKKIVMALREEFERVKEDLLKELREKTTEIKTLSDEVTRLRTKVDKLEEKIDDAEAYERRDTLVFSGEAVPQVTLDENCTSIVCQLVKDKLKVQMSPTDISTAHRLGKKPSNQQQDKRNIIVKLCRRDLKRDILFACRSIRPNMYVNENLTPIRSTILYVLRRARRTCGDKIKGCSSIGGRIFAWTKPQEGTHPGLNSVRMPVNTHMELETFCSNVLNQPLTSFLATWPH